MEILLLGIYSFFVWLIFIKFKWLPWNSVSQVTVVIIPIVGLTALILLLNINAPSSADVRVIKYVVQVIPQVRGRVVDVPAEGNRPMKKGDVLFRIDPTPYELDVKALEAQLAGAEGSANDLREQLAQAKGNTAALRAQIDLTKRRVKQYQELSASGAGNRFDLEKAQADLANLEGQTAAAVANEARAQAQLAAVVDGDLASVANIKASLAKARWDLSQTVMYAPADGTAINVQLRAGQFLANLPFVPAMTFVEDEFQVIALYGQNELWRVKPGDEAEIALDTYPGRGHQGEGEFHRLGPGPGPDRHVRQPAEHRPGADPAGPLRGEARHRRPRQGQVPRRWRHGHRRHLHGARRGDPHPAQDHPARRVLHQLPDPQAALVR